MKKQTSICAAIVILCSSYAPAGTWQTLEYPGAEHTFVEGAGNGYICGFAEGVTGGPHTTTGYTYDGTTWQTYYSPDGMPDVTGACGNTVVGTIWGTHSFIYDQTTWTIIEKPGALSTLIRGTNGSVHVGRYFDTTAHGFIYDGTILTTLDKPGASSTNINGISGNNIFGNADDSGFIYDGLTWQTFDIPGALWTEVRGVSGKYIVGNYKEAPDTLRCFLYDTTTLTTIDIPLSYDVYIMGITGDTIAGSYTYDFMPHLAVYTIPEPATLLLLGLGALWNLKKIPRTKPLAESRLDGT